MSSQLEQLLGYLERDGVTEVLFGSGRPIAMRKAGTVTNITARPLSADQLAHIIRGADINALIPESDGEGPSGEIYVGKRRALARVARRGNEIVVSLTRPEGAPAQQVGAPLGRTAPPADAAPRAKTPTRAKSTTSARAKTPTSARAKTPTSARAKSPTAARAKSATNAPRSKTPSLSGRSKSPAVTPVASAFDSFSLDSLELGSPQDTPAPPPAARPAPAMPAPSLELDDLELGAPTLPGASAARSARDYSGPRDAGRAPTIPMDVGIDIDMGTVPPARPAAAPARPPADAGFDIDLSTEPPKKPAASMSALAGLPMGAPKPAAPTGLGVLGAKPPAAAARPELDMGFELDLGTQPPAAKTAAVMSLELDDDLTAPPVVSRPIAYESTQQVPVPVAAARAPAPVAAARAPAPAPAPAAMAPVSREIARADTGAFGTVVRRARERGASDLHVSAARVTSIRVNGELIPLDEGAGPLTAAAVEGLLLPLLDSAQRATLEELGYIDLALEAPGGGRLRANISRQQQGLKGTFRLALAAPQTLEQLGLPADLAKVVHHHQGLIVIAGPSGHGKTTTLAALVDLLNSSKPYHILTIEDPVEIVHPRKQAVISQRETGRHTVSFARGLKASLREDPDVIVIGELRDRESVEIALTAAETGHLVIATMSTPSAAKTIDRLIDMFPPEEHSQVRASIAGALRAIIAQRLLPKRGGGIVPAIELVTGVLALAVLIRDDKLYQLPNLMQRGKAFGMIRFDESLLEHVRAGRVDEDVALAVAEGKKEFAAQLRPAAAAAQPAPAAKSGAIWGFGKKDK